MWARYVGIDGEYVWIYAYVDRCMHGMAYVCSQLCCGGLKTRYRTQYIELWSFFDWNGDVYLVCQECEDTVLLYASHK